MKILSCDVFCYLRIERVEWTDDCLTVKYFILDPGDRLLGCLRDAARLHDVLLVDAGQPGVGLLPDLELLVQRSLLQGC